MVIPVAMSCRIRQVFALCVLAALPASVAALFHPKQPPWTWEGFRTCSLWVDTETAARGVPANPSGVLRPLPGEWDVFFSSLLERWSPGRPVIVRCDARSCVEAEVVARRLQKAGMDRVYVLREKGR